VRRRLWLAGAAALLLVAAPGATDSTAWGLPAGGSVVGGQATISSSSAKSLLIQQSTSKAIINWNSFSIAHGQSVLFQTPGSGSISLNRVTGGGASFLNGSLSSNGQIWIVNPNGVLIGSGAQINVAGLLLTTADIANSDFMAGNYNFGIASPNPNAGIVNRGDIEVQSGSSVVLAAPSVDNQGIVEATLGTIEVAGAKTFTVDFYGDKLLSFAVTGAVDQTPIGRDGQPVDALVSNSGTLAADGGQVLITARAAANIIDNLINTTGIVQANSVSIQNGMVVFDAGDGGLSIGGMVSAAGQAPGTTGGTVQALGGTVTVASNAKIDVSGQAGGGTALIGGNFKGQGPQQNAQTTTVQAGAVIDADAVTSGNGGQVAVWSNGATTVNGTITARGGSQSGDGGYIETSGFTLDVAGVTIDTSALAGATGTWLLDPENLDINSFGAGAIGTALSNNNVVVETTHTGTSATGVSGFYGLTSPGAGDITVGSTIAWSSANTLTLSAYHSIDVNANIDSSGSGALVLTANTGNGGGTVTQSRPITAASLDLLGTGVTYTLTNASNKIGSLAGNTGTVSLTDSIALVIGPAAADADITTSGTLTLTSVGTVTQTQPISALGLDLLGSSANYQLTGPGNTIGTLAANTSEVNLIDSTALKVGTVTGTTGINAAQAVTLTAPTLTLGANITTAGGIVTFDAPVTLASNVTITTNHGVPGVAVNFDSTVNGTTAGAQALSIYADLSGGGNPPGIVTFVGAVGSAVPLGALYVSADSISLGGNVSTSGGRVEFSAPGLVLASSVAVNTTAHGSRGADVLFDHDIDGTAAGVQALTVTAGTGTITLGGGAGVAKNLGAVTLNAAQISLGGSIGTAGGAVIFNGPVVLATSIDIDTTQSDHVTGAAVSFDSTVDASGFGFSHPTLTVNAGAGIVAFGDDVGGFSPLGAITIGAASVNLGGNLTTYGGAVEFDAPVVLTSDISIDTTDHGFAHNGAAVSFNGTLDGAQSFDDDLSIAAGSGTVTFAHRVGADYLDYVPDIGVSLGNVTISSAGYVDLSMAYGTTGEGFSALSLTVAGFFNSPGAATFTADSFISTNTGGNAGNVTIRTSGSISIARDIFAGGGWGGNGNGGAVTIDAGGSVSIGGGNGNGNYNGLLASDNLASIEAEGSSVSMGSGSGGEVQITGSSISLPFGVTSRGGDAAGATSNGGNGANITLTATNGNVTIGSASSGDDAMIDSGGGNSTGGWGGAAGNVTISGTQISLFSVSAGGGNSLVTSGSTLTGYNGTKNAGGNITLIASATSGPAVILYGNSDPATGLGNVDGNVTLLTAGGEFGDTNVGMSHIPNGTFAGNGGNIVIEGTSGGAGLNGYIRLATSSMGALDGGSTVTLATAGGVGHGGSISLKGPVQGMTTGTENLLIVADNGTASISGAVGSVTPLNSVTFGLATGSSPLLPSGSSLGSFTVHGLTANTLTMAAGSESLALDGATSIATSATLSGTVTTSSLSLMTTPVTLAGNTTIDAAGTLNLGTVNGTAAGAQSLTISDPSNLVALNGALGGTTALGGVSVTAGSVQLSANIDTAAGVVSLTAPVTLENSVSIDTTGSGSTSNGAAVTFGGTVDAATGFTQGLGVTAGIGTVTFDGQVGHDNATSTGVTLGAVALNGGAIDLDVSPSVGGFSAASFTILGPSNGPGAASLTANSYISTPGANMAINVNNGVTIGGQISTAGSTLGTVNGGSVTIVAGGAVSIGASQMILGTNSCGNALCATTYSINASGFNIANSSQSPGNGGAISVTGSSITLPYEVTSSGGNAEVTGSTANGGNASTVILAATGGGVTVGSPSSTTGNVVGVDAQGGWSTGGNGGNGAAVTVSGTTTLSLPRIYAQGGSTQANTVSTTAGNGGAITLIATATNGDAVVLYGSSASPTDPLPGPATLVARSGEIGVSAPNTLDGTLNGTGGNIAIESSSGGASLQGSADIRLATSTGPDAGSTVTLSSSGGLGTGGTITVAGPIVATTVNAESLHLAFADGSALLKGSVGTSSKPLNVLSLGGTTTLPTHGTQGSVTFDNAVYAATVDDLRSTGSIIFDALLTANTLTMASNSAVNLTFDVSPAIATSATLAGTVTSTGGLTITAPITLAGSTTIDAAGVLTLGTVDGTNAGVQSFTISDSGHTVVLTHGALGGNTALGAVQMTASQVNIDTSVVTAGGAVTFNAPITLMGDLTVDTTNNGSVAAGANQTFNGTIDAASANTAAQSLTVKAGTAGDVAFEGTVGGNMSLKNLTVTAASTTAGTVITDAVLESAQSYTGAVSLDGNYFAPGGFSAPGAVTLNGNTAIDITYPGPTTPTGTITLGPVNTGAYSIVLGSDSLALTDAWSGTGTRSILTESTGDSIGLGDGASGNLTLNQVELTDLADGAPAMVTISNTNGTGAITSGPSGFTFNAPLTLDPGSIALNGTLTKNSGSLALATSGAITGSVDLGAGTGLFTLAATSVDLTGTVNSAVTINTAGLTGAGPFTLNGVSLTSAAPSNNGNTNTNQVNNAVSSSYQSNQGTGTGDTGGTGTGTGTGTGGGTGTGAGTGTGTGTGTGGTDTGGSSGGDFTLVLSNINPTSGGPGGGGDPGTVSLTDASPSTGSTSTVGGTDTGSALFVQISPTSLATNGIGSGPTTPASDSSRILVFVSQPAPVKTVSHDQPLHPALTHPFVPGYVNTVLFPNVPKGGVPGIKYNFSSSGNSGLW
jgi:filamentous hemagglutinin family protein